MQCHIISIGDELLIGDTVNTNASWLGQELTGAGVEITRIFTIGDQTESMKNVLQTSMTEADFIVITGGLGPTDDDITKQVLADIFECEMIIHEPTLNFIKEMFKKRNLPFSESNYRQAEILDCSEVLFNKQGTAPGMWIDREDCHLAVLPGVPFEMKHLVNDKLLPKIHHYLKGQKKHHAHFILTAGVGESTLADEIVSGWEEKTTDEIEVAFLPDPEGTKVRISARAYSEEEFEQIIRPVVQHIKENGGDVIVGEGKDLHLAGVVGSLLQKQQTSMAIAESCTGGYVANSITNIPGCSKYMKGGVVSYSNEVKKKILGVRPQSLDEFGAVSKPVALQMAKGVARELDSDVGISTTGIAGPGGGTEEKPVGLVWIGFWSKKRHFAVKAQFTNDRIINKERTTAVAFDIVRRSLLELETMPYGLKKHKA